MLCFQTIITSTHLLHALATATPYLATSRVAYACLKRTRTLYMHSAILNTSTPFSVKTQLASLTQLQSYIWNSAENSTAYNQLTFGVMYKELASNFQSFAEGKETKKARLYVGHDGSMVSCRAYLQFILTHSLSVIDTTSCRLGHWKCFCSALACPRQRDYHGGQSFRSRSPVGSS